MSSSAILDVANELEAKGTVFYEIKDGFFYSNRRAPQLTLPVEDSKFIRAAGDVLLRIYCDKGTVSLYWPNGRYDEEKNEVPVFTGFHIEVFKDGYPFANYGGMPSYRKSDSDAKVWATYEILGDTQRKAVSRWSDPSDETKGLKMRYGEEVWQIVGRDNPGHSVNTIQKLN